MAVINIPSFDFSGFSYAEILEALIEFKRTNLPELTDESAEEPLIQLLRAFALVGHLNNTLLDVVANESTLPTANLVETVRNMLKLIDYEMKSATPSQADLIYTLSQVLTSTTEVVPQFSAATTSATDERDAIPFEALEALSVSPTNAFTIVLAEDEDDGISSNVITDLTTNTNDEAPATTVTPWATPEIKDSLYFGHAQAMWDEIQIDLDTAASGISGVWEYFDGNFSQRPPDSVVDNGNGTIRFNINGLLGSSDRTGTKVKVQLNTSTASEFPLESAFDGSNNYIETLGSLGQTTISTTITDYTVGSDWQPVTVLEDNVSDFTASGTITFRLPQTLTKNWSLTDKLQEGTTKEYDTTNAFFLRYRITGVSGSPTSPVINFVKMDTGSQYVKRVVTQGIRAEEDPLGSSDGTANQTFETAKDFFIDNTSTVTIDDVEWTEVDNFLSSSASDQHYVVELGEDDRATIKFGDGITGLIPPSGIDNISVSYRFGANEDGNVGEGTITSDTSSLSFVNTINNPRPATGWRQADGATTESLERVKIEGPASLRARNVAISPDDIRVLTRNFTTENNVRPFARSKPIEEGFGPKTIKNVVVASDGGLALTSQLTALDEFFNGDQFSSPPKEKHLVANQSLTSVNFSPRTINVTMDITVVGSLPDSTLRAQISNELNTLINPLALRDDGVSFEWEFGEEIPVSRLVHQVFRANTDVIKVTITSPTASIFLLPTELPKLGTVTINTITRA